MSSIKTRCSILKSFPKYFFKLPCSVAALAVTAALLIFFLAPFVCFAQEEYTPKLGYVERPSLEMTYYPGDSTMDAVVLYDFAKVQFHYDDLRGFMMTTKRWIRIKILKESALDRASVSLEYRDRNNYENTEIIENIEGFTYNLDGHQIVTSQLDKKSITRERLSEHYSSMKLNLPNAKKGSIIEYAYTLRSPLAVRNKPDTWSFQSNIPVQWSEYQITIPHFLDYKITMNGYLGLHINKKEQVNIRVGHTKFDGPGMDYRFVVKDAPAFNKEPFITTASDYISKIRFELERTSVPGDMIRRYSTTWEQVDKTFMDVPWFGGQLRQNVLEKGIKETLLSKASDSTGKMKAGYYFVQNLMRWDGTNGLAVKGGVKNALENKKGSATEINLLLTSLLRDMGLDCDPVVLSTRANGQIHEHIPSMDGFNYVVSKVKIGNREFLLDASQPYARPGMLPEHALNGRGRVIPKKGKGYFIDLKPIELKSKFELINADILPGDGIVKGKYSISMGGYESLDWREHNGTMDDPVQLENVRKKFPEWEITNLHIVNKNENLEKPVQLKFDFEFENESSSPDVMYFNPMIVGSVTENPLKTPQRIYPLDLTTGFTWSYIGNFTLPEGYVLEEIPKVEIVALPEKAGRFLYRVQQTGNIIEVNSTIIVSKTNFVPEEYGALREFFQRIVQRHAQPIVIKKKVN
jgi:hypothetical protein